MTDHNLPKRLPAHRGKAYRVQRLSKQTQLKVVGDSGESNDSFGTVFLTINLAIKHLLSARTLMALAVVITSVSSCNSPKTTVIQPQSEAESK